MGDPLRHAADQPGAAEAERITRALNAGQIDEARTLHARHFKDHPKNPELQSLARLFAALDTVAADKAGTPPPIHADVPGDPGAEEAARLIEPATSLLRAGKSSQAALLIETAELLDGSNPQVSRLSDWLKTGAEPVSLALVAKDANRPQPRPSEAPSPPAPTPASTTPAPIATGKSPADGWSGKSARKSRALRRAALFAGIGGALLVLAAVVPVPDSLTEPAEALALKRASLRALSAGMVREVTRREGDSVTANETLVKLFVPQGEVVVTSPFSGVVLQRPADLEGRAVQPGELLAEVGVLSRMRLEILVPERELAKVAVGQKVLFKARGYPGVEFSGAVERIPLTAVHDEALQANVVRVVATVDNAQGLLRDHLTGYARIDTGTTSVLSLLTSPFVHWLRVRYLF